MVGLTDYTLEGAFRRRLPLTDISRIISLLRHYGAETCEVSLATVAAAHYPKGIWDKGLAADLRCRIRPFPEDVALAKAIGFKQIAVVWKHRSGARLAGLSAVLAAVGVFAHEIVLIVENGACALTGEWACYGPIIQEHRIKRLVYCDNRSELDPFSVIRKLAELRLAVDCPLEFVAANGFGLATANTLAAIKAGVEHVGTSIGGVGGRGKAATEEVLMALRHLWKEPGVPAGWTLAEDCHVVLGLLGICVAPDKAIIGRKVFAHESGIHVDGVVKHAGLYEPIDPEEVGLAREIVIGKHSGTAALIFKFKQWKMELTRTRAAQLLEQVRELAERQKVAVSDSQLQELYHEAEAYAKRLP